jgi:tetratricopeptide (TPR) repeat protein
LANRPGAGGGQRFPNAGQGLANRPGAGGSGQRFPNAGNRPGLANRPGAGGGGERWANAGNRGDWANRPGAGGRGDRWGNAGNWNNRPGAGNWNNNRGNRLNNWANNGNINRGNFLSGNNLTQNNLSLASNRFNNLNGGSWGYNHYQNNWSDWHAGSWNNWNSTPAAWYGAGAASAVGANWLWGAGDNSSSGYSYSNPFYDASASVDTAPAFDYSQPVQVPAPVSVNVDNSSYAAADSYAAPATSYAAPATSYASPAASYAAPATSYPAPAADTSPSEPFAPPAPDAQQAPAEQAAPEVPPEAASHFDAARQAFKMEEYDRALKEVEEAIKLLPKDATLHEFRALVLFAQKKYKDAASGIYAVLAVGPGWNWETMSGLYAKPETYTKQLRALEAYARDNPKAADARFLLAYQYLVLGSVPDAVKQLKEFETLVPKDQLAPQLVKAFTESADTGKPKVGAG